MALHLREHSDSLCTIGLNAESPVPFIKARVQLCIHAATDVDESLANVPRLEKRVYTSRISRVLGASTFTFIESTFSESNEFFVDPLFHGLSVDCDRIRQTYPEEYRVTYQNLKRCKTAYLFPLFTIKLNLAIFELRYRSSKSPSWQRRVKS